MLNVFPSNHLLFAGNIVYEIEMIYNLPSTGSTEKCSSTTCVVNRPQNGTTLIYIICPQETENLHEIQSTSILHGMHKPDPLCFNSNIHLSIMTAWKDLDHTAGVAIKKVIHHHRVLW